MIDFLIDLDQQILLVIQNSIRSKWLTPLFLFFTHLGDAGILWLGISGALLFQPKTRNVGIAGIIAILFSVLVNNLLLKNLVERPRPFTAIPELTILIPTPTDFSFPSGHTASSFAAAMALSFGVPEKYKVPLFIIAALIGFSRLYIGVHYPSDVLFGLIDGLILGLIAHRLTSH